MSCIAIFFNGNKELPLHGLCANDLPNPHHGLVMAQTKDLLPLVRRILLKNTSMNSTRTSKKWEHLPIYEFTSGLNEALLQEAEDE